MKLNLRCAALWSVPACGFGTALLGQSVRGRIVRADHETPAVGVVVTAIDERGTAVARGLSDTSGDYVLELSAPGRYQLRVLRIGFRPTVVTGIDVAVAGERVENVVLDELPVVIASMTVQGARDCDLTGSDAAMFLQLWEQARAALVATRVAEQSRTLDVRSVTIGGHVDAVAFFDDPAIGPLSRALHPDADTASAREVVADNAPATTQGGTVVEASYGRRWPDGSLAFDAPDAEALLSDAFVAGHCFTIASSPRDHPAWIGVGFAPRAARDSVVDIRGVLWLDRSTAELRRLEYEYTNLPPGEFTLCDPAPDRLHWPVGVPACSTYSTGWSRLGLGGDEDFVRLPSGEWLVARWTKRTSPDSQKFRFSGNKSRETIAGHEKCFGGKDCHEIWIMWPRLVTTSSAVTSVRRSGREIFHDAAPETLITAAAATRAGEHPAHLVGTITNLDGQPLTFAIVQTEDPGRVGITDASGEFQVRTLPPGPMAATVQCRGYHAVRFTLPMLPDSTRHVRLALRPSIPNRMPTDCSVTP